jgi:hypothetical protein
MASFSVSLTLLLGSVKTMKLFFADTLALAELYSRDSREFPLSAPDFASTPLDLLKLKQNCIDFVHGFSRITQDSKFEDGYLLLRQLVHSLELLKPLEPTLTSWQHTFDTLQTLYFTLLLILTITSDMAVFISSSSEESYEAEAEAQAQSEAEAIVPQETQESQAAQEKPELGGGFSTNLMGEILKSSQDSHPPQVFDVFKSLNFGGGESILHYAARTVQPLDSAFATLFQLVNSGNSNLIGLNSQSSKPLTENGETFPSGSTFLHTLSRRFVQESPTNETNANFLVKLRSYGASPRILDSEGQSVLSILSGTALRGGSESKLIQETLIALEGGATENQRGRAAYLREKYYTHFFKKSNVARVWLNSIVHDAVITPFPEVLLMDKKWISAWEHQLVYSADNGNHYYTSVEELEDDFARNEQGVPYILLQDLLNEDSYSFKKRGMFRCNIDKDWKGPRDDGEAVQEAAESAGFQVYPTFALRKPVFTQPGALGPFALGSAGGGSERQGGGGGGRSGGGRESGGPGGPGGSGGPGDATASSSQSERALMFADVEARRTERLKREALEAKQQALQSEAAQAEEQEFRNKERVAKAARVQDPEKLVRVKDGYRPIDKHVIINVAGLSYRYDAPEGDEVGSYYQFNTLKNGGQWEPVTDPRYLMKLKTAQFA